MKGSEDIRNIAVRYLGAGAKTGRQVREYLRRKGFEDDDIDVTVRELEEYRYIDDLAYSVMYFEYGFEKGRGISRIKRELSQKGVDSDVIEEAYGQLEDVPDQYETARSIAEDMVRGADMERMDHDERRRLMAKVGRRLSSRGFTSDIIYRVLDDLR